MRRLTLSSSSILLSGVGVALLLSVGWPHLAAPKRGNDPAGVVNHVALDSETIEARRKILDVRIGYFREIDLALKSWLGQQKSFRECCDHLVLLSLTQYPEFLADLDEEPEHRGRTAREKIAHYLRWVVEENPEIYLVGTSGDPDAMGIQLRLRNDLAELSREANPMLPATPMAVGALDPAAPASRPQAPSKGAGTLGARFAP
jgi:hypothetical protein